MTPRGAARILRSGSGSAERLRVFVSEANASDLFWLEMVFKGSRLPYDIEAVTDRESARECLERQLAVNCPDLIFVDGVDVLPNAPLPGPLFVLANGSARGDFDARFGDPLHFIEKPFTNQKLFHCLATAHGEGWAVRRAV